MKREIFEQERLDWDLNSQFHRQDKDSPYRVWFWQKVLDLFELEQEEKSILEVGCGAGLFTSILKTKSNKVDGVDFSPGMIDVARKNNPSVKYILASAEKLPFPDSSFDIVVAAMLFHHLKVQGLVDQSLFEIKRVLKRRGVFCLLDHSGNFLSRLTLFLFNQAKKALIRFKGEFPSSGSFYEIPFRSKDIVDALGNDFKVRRLKPAFTPFFQFFSAFSHGTEYLFGKGKAISFEKATLPLVVFLENHFSFSWLCTELLFKATRER